MKTPRIIAQWIDWYTSLPAWQRWVPVGVVVLLWLALVLS